MARRNKPAGSTREERDRIALGRLESFIDQTLEGQMQCPTCRKQYDIKDIPASAVALWRSRYDKLRPSLASTEVTITDPRDQVDPVVIAARLAAMFDAKPELLEQVMQIRAAAAQKHEQQSSQEHVSH